MSINFINQFYFIFYYHEFVARQMVLSIKDMYICIITIVNLFIYTIYISSNKICIYYLKQYKRARVLYFMILLLIKHVVMMYPPDPFVPDTMFNLQTETDVKYPIDCNYNCFENK